MNKPLRFACAKDPCPILNTPRFDQTFLSPLPVDNQGLLRPVETIAFPGTPFSVVDHCSETICQVQTSFYPVDRLFVDRRFLLFSSSPFPEPKRVLPSKEAVLQTLSSLLGSIYIWGGNYSRGIPQLLSYYPPKEELSALHKTIWGLQGVDCSGLLFEATCGYTPRNSSELLFFGQPLNIEGLNAQQIAALLQPLDLLVWKKTGHVVICLDRENVIESTPQRGVATTPTVTRLEQILSTRTPSNHPDLESSSTFVARRWFP